MQVKNISARGWWVMGKMIKPGDTEAVEATLADIGDNPDLVIVEEVQAQAQDPQDITEPVEPVSPDEPVALALPEVQADTVEDIGEVIVEAQETKSRKPGRPPKAD